MLEKIEKLSNTESQSVTKNVRLNEHTKEEASFANLDENRNLCT